MSIFCDFMCELNKSGDTMKDFIINEIVSKNVIRNYNTLEEVIKNNKGNDNLNIVFDAFSLSLSMNDRYLVYKREDYNINFNLHIHFDIYHEVQDWDAEMMRFLGYIMQKFNMNCALEYYSEIVLICRNSKITVDESNSGRIQKLPYELLGISYQEGNIQSVIVS